MKFFFPAAPWPVSLKLLSFFATLLLCVVAYAAWRAAPAPAGFTHNFGVGVALVPLASLPGALISIVRGYTINAGELSIQRLFHSTRIPLSGLRRVWADAGVCKGSRRIVGNGGLYSFTGWFENDRLGRYRLFVTDFKRGVVLEFEDRVLVVSPATPHAFIEYLKKSLPGVTGEADSND
jgi:hypothetical protein